jgi:hypothetical protein
MCGTFRDDGLVISDKAFGISQKNSASGTQTHYGIAPLAMPGAMSFGFTPNISQTAFGAAAKTGSDARRCQRPRDETLVIGDGPPRPSKMWRL